MGPWTYVLDEAAFHFFLSRSAVERRKLAAAFEQLRANPHREADYFCKDATGRTLNVCGFRPFLVTFWRDEFVSEIRIVNIQWIRF
jgi:hypothetical protein